MSDNTGITAYKETVEPKRPFVYKDEFMRIKHEYDKRIAELEQQLADTQASVNLVAHGGVEKIREGVKERDELKEELKHRVAQVHWKCIEIDNLRAENNRLREAIKTVNDWAKAYPLDMFPEPNLTQAAEALKAADMTLDNISAHAMRHVITRIKQVMDKALAEGKDGKVT